MLVVVPFFSGDSKLAVKNINHWISMDGHVDYQCLLSYDTETNPTEVRDVARKYFSRVSECVYACPENRNWPYASNWAFHNTVWYLIGAAKATKGKQFIEPQPWLWVESDAVAMKPGWIRAIDNCHKAGGKPFTGHWNHNTGVWNGVSVYPPNPNRYVHFMMLCDSNPWDVVASKEDHIEKNLHVANDLFQHIWTDPATDKPFSFTSMAEARALIRSTVVLFHRCKDGSLIDLLQEQSSVSSGVIKQDTGNTLLTIPFCNKDHDAAFLNLQLCRLLDGKTEHRVMLSYDEETRPEYVCHIDELARDCFGTVFHYCYESPKEKKWPKPQNHAFLHTSGYIERHFHGGWFWWEMDAVPIRRNWFTDLSSEYERSGKPFGGHIVADMGHMNGTAFYPCDLRRYVPNLNSCEKAWDVAIRSQTIALTHRMNELIQNIWAFDKEGRHTLGNGEVATFKDMDSVNKIVDFSACIFHRCKDGSLQRRLLEKYKDK